MGFGENLRRLRKARGITQQVLADALDTTQGCIAGWESGRRTPELGAVKRVADYFRVPVTSMLAEKGRVRDDSIEIAELLSSNEKLRLLFDRTHYLSDTDLDAVIGIVSAISKERESK